MPGPEHHRDTDLYVTDLDGTLLDADGRLPARSRAALADLLAARAPLTYCTARGLPDSGQALDGLPFTLPAGYYNGALVARPDTGEVLDERTLPPAATPPLLDALRAAGARPQLIGRTGTEQVVLTEPPGNPAEEAFHRARAGRDPRLRTAPGYPPRVDAAYALVCLDAAATVRELARAATALAPPGVAVTVFDASEHPGHLVLQIGAADADKGTAVRRIAELAGYRPDRLVVFGDSGNDLPMFAAARDAYAVAGATEAVRRLARQVIGPSVLAAVPQKLHELLERPWPHP
ncbi:HAD family hydrolase [Kitasatospora phosalacinea]|uniref:Hydrolase n=1 Tax=Kitasatospora phosalacinea TaxID=2065 RepID=A0A9W6ULE1_9ACTN|nr:HAD family hydrolase [Kitasatospora phosalacinea]GLW52018.1 hypothetical protein Kpho01_00290 [Kitasatospora phosalacinea]